MTPTNLLTIVATSGLGMRCVVSERVNPAGHSYGNLYDIFRTLLYRKADAVVAQTHEIANWLRCATSANIVTIPNFIVRSPVNCLNGRLQQVVAVGRLAHQKGFDLLITAFSMLAKDFPEWTLLILGEGPERNSLQSLIDHYSLQSQVELLGFVDNPLDILQISSIAAQPSRFEGFPNALLEAMASGLPTVASYTAGSMLIDDGVNGLLIPPEDVDALANALRKLMGDPELRSQLGKAALQVKETYSQDKVMMLWDDVLFATQPFDTNEGNSWRR